MPSRLRFAALTAIAVVGCTPGLSVPDNVIVTCKSDKDCPTAFHCTNGDICVPSTREDSVAPTVVSSAWDKPAVAAGQTITLTITVSEGLLVDPILTFVSGGTQYSLKRTAFDAASLTYAFAYTATGSEAEGTWLVSASLLDLAGNSNNQSLLAIHLDFSAPQILTGSAVLTLTPDRKTNPLIEVTAVTNGTRLRLSLSTDEPLAIDSAPSVLLDGTTTIGVMTQPAGARTVAILDLTWSAALGVADGTHPVSVTLTDLAGNTANVAIADTSLIVDTVPPNPPDVIDAATITLVREPWGDGTTAAQTSRILGLAGATDPGASVLAFDVGSVPACDDSCTFAAQARASAVSGPDGSFLVDFGRYDRAVIYIVAADAAGNVDGRANPTDVLVGHRVVNTRLTAITAFNENTLQQAGITLGAVQVFADAFPTTPTISIDRTRVSVADLASATTTGASSWTIPSEPTTSFDRRAMGVLGYLPTQRQVFAFSGEVTLSLPYPPPDTFTAIRDTGNWRVITGGFGPGGSNIGAMAYDIVGDVLVYFDGVSSTWGWNGITWTPLCVGGAGCGTPPSSALNVMVTDPTRRVIVGFDAAHGVWEWNGSSWALACDGSCSGPSSTSDMSAAYDPNLGEVITFGSTSDTMWSWNGARWLQRCTDSTCVASRPSPRSRPVMAYDGAHANVVLFSGYDTVGMAGLTDTYVWNGSVWTKRTPVTTPQSRWQGNAVYDASRQRVVVSGGYNVPAGGGVNNPIIEWDGTNWQIWEPVASPAAPHAITYDPQSQHVISVDGGGTHIWDGFAWVTGAITGTPGTGTMATPLTGTRRPVLLLSSDRSTYTLNGTAWQQNCTSGTCGLTSAGPLATDGATIIVSGQGANDVWRWNGSVWAAACTGCTSHFQNGLAYGGAPGFVISTDQSDVFSMFSAGAWASLGVNNEFAANYTNNAIAYDVDRNGWGVVPGQKLGVGSVPIQNLQQILGLTMSAPVLAATSASAPSGPGGSGVAVAYDERYQQIVELPAVGGSTPLWRSGGATQPAHLFRLALHGIVDTTVSSIESIDVTWVGSATSKKAGAASSAITFAIWAIDHWQPLTATAVDATHFTTHIDSSVLPAHIGLDQVVFGASATIIIAALPDGTSADLAGFANINTDFAEALISYRYR